MAEAETVVDGDRAAKKPKLESTEQDCLRSKIAKQIDYYFSDVNLVKDKFMREQFEKNENSISLSVLQTFSRLAQLTKDEAVIIDALKDHDSEFMHFDAEKKVLRRKKPIPDREELQKQLDLKTVHISGFPDSLKFDDLHRYCSQFGEVESLSMRQFYKTKQFKGCIHVVFKNESDAKKVLEGEPLKFKDRELRRESMEQYYKRKEEIKQKKKDRKNGVKCTKGRSKEVDNEEADNEAKESQNGAKDPSVKVECDATKENTSD